MEVKLNTTKTDKLTDDIALFLKEEFGVPNEFQHKFMMDYITWTLKKENEDKT